jgi:hypothetical protein
MQASKEMGAPAAGSAGREDRGVVPRRDLDDSWFRWQKPQTLPPARPVTTPPSRPGLESLDDEIADAWFV